MPEFPTTTINMSDNTQAILLIWYGEQIWFPVSAFSGRGAAIVRRQHLAFKCCVLLYIRTSIFHNLDNNIYHIWLFIFAKWFSLVILIQIELTDWGEQKELLKSKYCHFVIFSHEYERMSGIAAFDWSHRSTLLALISDAGPKRKFHL